MTITLRLTKGSNLEYSELDGNFVHLRDLAAQTTTDVTALQVSVASLTPSSIITISPSLGTSGADASPAFQAAYTACVAAGGGTISIPPGTYNLLSGTGGNGNGAISLQQNHPGMVWIRGSGVGVTMIKLSAACRHFVICDGANTGPGALFRYLCESDFTLDGNNIDISGIGNYGVIFQMGVSASVNGLYFQRLASINVPRTTQRTHISIVCTTNGILGQGVGNAYTLQNVLLEDFDFGKDRTGGGWSAFGIGGYTGAVVPSSMTSSANKYTTGWGSTSGWVNDIEVGNIIVRRGRWDSGASVITNFGTTVGVSIGGISHQKRDSIWHVEGVTCVASGDDNFEFGSALNLNFVNCTSDSAFFEGTYFNNVGGMPIPEEQNIRVVGYKHLDTYYSGCPPLVVDGSLNGSPFGNFSMRDCQDTILKTGNNQSIGGHRSQFLGAIASITIEGYASSSKPSYTAIADGEFWSYGPGFLFALQGGRTRLNIDGASFRLEPRMDANGHTSPGWSVNVLNLSGFTSGLIDIKNVAMHFDCVKTGTIGTSGTVAVRMTAGASSTGPGGMRQTDNFSSNRLTRDYIDETANVADMTVSGGVLSCTANLTVEHRMLWASNSTATANRCTGPFVDSVLWFKAIPGATTTLFKAGVVMKRSELEPTSYLDCYVDDDGANTRVRIDEVMLGVRTNLATNNSGTRITAAVPFWVRANVTGNVVTLDYLSTAPTDGLNGGTIITTTTYTLATAARKLTFGRSALGWGGISFIPQGTDATIDDLNRNALSVMAGRIANVRIEATKNVGAVQVIDWVNPTVAWSRVDGRWFDLDNFSIGDCDGVTTTVLSASLNTGMMQKIRRSNWDYVAPPVPAAISPGASPYTYTNADAYAEDVAIYAGTVSDISVSRDGGTTFGVVNSTTGATTRLNPGEQVKVTYSVVPTMIKHPVL